jgi:hypothetical protein
MNAGATPYSPVLPSPADPAQGVGCRLAPVAFVSWQRRFRAAARISNTEVDSLRGIKLAPSTKFAQIPQRRYCRPDPLVS